MKRKSLFLIFIIASLMSYAQEPVDNAELMPQREKELVGVWQMTTVKNGVNFFSPEYKYYNADHTWFTLRTNAQRGGIYAGGKWKLTDANTIVEHNDFSINQLYIDRDVVLHVNSFKANHHQITFTPFEINFGLTFDYEKVPTSSNGGNGSLMPTDAVYFNRLEDYPYALDGKTHVVRVKNYQKEEISMDEVPEAVRNGIKLRDNWYGIPTSTVYVAMAFSPSGDLTSCMKKGANYSRKSPRRIYFAESDSGLAVDVNSLISMGERDLDNDELYYLVFKPLMFKK